MKIETREQEIAILTNRSEFSNIALTIAGIAKWENLDASNMDQALFFENWLNKCFPEIKTTYVATAWEAVIARIKASKTLTDLVDHNTATAKK